MCAKGGCVAGSAKDCNDDNPCTSDGCDGKTGACTAAPATGNCDDNNPCSSGDSCAAGKCVGGANICACQADSDCAGKNGGDLCKGVFVCDKAKVPFQCVIKAGSVPVCDASKDTACASSQCDGKTGTCGLVAEANGKVCDDGSVCTVADTCVTGLCKAGSAPGCDDGNSCTTDSCDAKLGCSNAANVLPCEDSNKCTSGDTCLNKACAAGPAKKCDDTSVCTADSCDPTSGGCVFAPQPGTCDDDDACTQNDACAVAVCKGTAVNCDDPNACTLDSCSKASGCGHANITAPCDADGNACTENDACKNGACGAGLAKVCNDNKVCTTDTCDKVTGTCTFGNNTSACDDGNACTGSDLCGNGACAGIAKKCDDGNACTDDSCQASNGTCVFANNNKTCDDGNLCTSSDTCAAGSCSGAPVVCNDNQVCTNDSCTVADGTCGFVNNTKACNDGKPCTTNDLCGAGSCAGTAKSCADSDACTADSCNATTGTCANTPIVGCGGNCSAPSDCNDSNPCTDNQCAGGKCAFANNTLACDDGNGCTVGDVCESGVCAPGGAKGCNDSKVCTTDTCTGGVCGNTNNTVSCDDSNACTTGDICSGGACAGIVKSCNDNNPCTNDSCNATTGACVATNNTLACNDGNPCTDNDLCSNGSCAGSTKNCNDSNFCTADSCSNGSCVNSNTTSACDDGNGCTVGDACANGSCGAGAAKSCDDGKVCTSDTCSAPSGTCVFTNNTSACTDSNACTTSDACSGGACIGGAAPNCNDGNPCSDDSCNTATGCVNAANTVGCDLDASQCTPDVCSNKSCTAGAAKVCNDSNPCTTDSCAASTGNCQFVNNTSPCNDGSACTSGDACGAGTCSGTAITCNDSLLCTTDSCIAASGCSHVNNTVVCSDGNACTNNDACSGGSCVPGTATNCSDGNPCTSDTCNTGTGVCSNPNVAEYTACGGTNFCFSGVCQACLVWDKEALATNGSVLNGVAVDGAGMLSAGLKNGTKDEGWLRNANQYGVFSLDKAITGAADDRFYSIARDGSGNYYAAGETDTSGAGSFDGWLVKFDSSKNQVWAMTSGTTRDDRWRRVIVASSGGVVVVGQNQIAQNNNDDGWLQRFDANGAPQWGANGVSVTGSEDDTLWGVAETTSGGFVAVGEVRTGSAGGRDGWFVAVSATGVVGTVKKQGTNNHEVFMDIAALADGTFLVVGWTQNSAGNGQNGWIRKLNASGDFIAGTELKPGGGANDRLLAVAPLTTGDFIAVGYKDPTNLPRVGWAIKLSSAPVSLFDLTYAGTSGTGELRDVIGLANGGWGAVGVTTNSSRGRMLKADVNGKVVCP